MKKIKTVFRIERDAKMVTRDVLAGQEWVLAGEGIATIKFDGTAAMVEDGHLFKRYDRKLEKRFAKKRRGDASFTVNVDMFKAAPVGFRPTEAEPDLKTGHWPGWLPVSDGPEDRWFNEAWATGDFANGTYELVGPKVQGNLYGLTQHELWRHGSKTVDIERTFDAIKDWLEANKAEGLVFHHPDGRMAKIRRKDFQMAW